MSNLLLLLNQRGVNLSANPGQRSYLLYATFTTAAAAPLPASLTIDTGGPLTVTDASSTISISGGRVVVNGTPTVNSGLVSPQFARVCGRAFGVAVPSRTTLTSGAARLGFATSALSDSNMDIGLDYAAPTIIRIKSAATVIDTLTLGAGLHEFWFVMRGTGGYLFSRVGGTGAYTLQWVYPTSTTAQYAKCYLNAIATTFEQDSWVVADLGTSNSRFATDSGLATSRTVNPIANTILVSTADAVIEHTVTYASAQSDLLIRYVDGANYWTVRVGATGSIFLIENTASVITQRGTAAGVFTGTNVYRIVTIQEGATIKVYVNNVLQITYASATASMTATSVRVFSIGSPVSECICWPRTVILPGV